MSEPRRPYVWQMVQEAIHTLGEETTNVAVRKWILEHYPNTNTNTIQCQIIVCTVNHPSRIHYPENQKPRLSTSQYDFLFRAERGKLAFYDPPRHGLWEIAEGDDGRLIVRRIDETIDNGEQSQTPSGHAFAAEEHLREYLVQHLDMLEEGLQLFVDDRENIGVEYSTPIGRIDILALTRTVDWLSSNLRSDAVPMQYVGKSCAIKAGSNVILPMGDGSEGLLLPSTSQIAFVML